MNQNESLIWVYRRSTQFIVAQTQKFNPIRIMSTTPNEQEAVPRTNSAPAPSEESYDFNAAACDGLFIGMSFFLAYNFWSCCFFPFFLSFSLSRHSFFRHHCAHLPSSSMIGGSKPTAAVKPDELGWKNLRAVLTLSRCSNTKKEKRKKIKSAKNTYLSKLFRATAWAWKHARIVSL